MKIPLPVLVPHDWKQNDVVSSWSLSAVGLYVQGQSTELLVESGDKGLEKGGKHALLATAIAEYQDRR